MIIVNNKSGQLFRYLIVYRWPVATRRTAAVSRIDSPHVPRASTASTMVWWLDFGDDVYGSVVRKLSCCIVTTAVVDAVVVWILLWRGVNGLSRMRTQMS